MPLHTVNVVAALNCEAKAIVDHFKLKKFSDKPFITFEGHADLNGNAVTLRVLISGIGAINMATAVGWYGGQIPVSVEQAVSPHKIDNLQPKHAVWLNIGIAGHGKANLGDGFIVSASQDILSNRTYYPPQVARRPVRTNACMSLNAPSTDYPEEGGLDMEASAFFSPATRFAESECVQSYKVVSDTPDNDVENLNAKVIQTLMQPHTKYIETYLCSLVGLLKSGPADTNRYLAVTISTQVLPRLRATHSQAKQCEQLAEQLAYIIDPQGVDALLATLLQCSDIKSALRLMTSLLNQHEPKLGQA